MNQRLGRDNLDINSAVAVAAKNEMISIHNPSVIVGVPVDEHAPSIDEAVTVWAGTDGRWTRDLWPTQSDLLKPHAEPA